MVLGKNSDFDKKKKKKKLAQFKENGPKKGPGLYGREIR